MKPKRKSAFLSSIATLLLFGFSAAFGAEAPTPRPKLILVVVFDQFRGDYLNRFESRFLPDRLPNGNLGGFRYLMKNGAYFPYGEYDITQCMTGPGHATILTGAYPYQNGIPTNFWYDRAKESKTYCSEDLNSLTIGAPHTNPHVGTSPRTMNSTTVGDELKNAGYASRVVTVALKDRAAILMGGHRADLAMWFDPEAQHWVSSSYYLKDEKLPSWMNELNSEVAKNQGEPYVWQPAGKSVLLADEIHGPAQFKHSTRLGSRDSYAMPYGSELTEQAAEKAIDAYQLGRNQNTDLFAVSFSSHDYAGHAWGPNAREMEEMTVAEDRMVSKLLNFVAKRVPLKNVVIALTGDHGIPPDPDWLQKYGIDAGRIPDEALASAVESAMTQAHGAPSKPWLGYFHDFNFYFTPSVLRSRGVSLADAEKTAKETLLQQKGVAYVLTSLEIEAGKLPPGMHARQIAKTYYPGRSADVTIIPKTFYMKAEDTVDHLTGYNYDRTVPIVLSGFGIRPGLYADHAEVVDIAPTLTFIAGTLAPSLSEGHVLGEILKSEHR